MTVAEKVASPDPTARRCRHLTHGALAALALYGAFLWYFRPATPFEWDEVLAQRGVLHYDVGAHAPQPPGIPAYIGAAKVVYLAVRDPLTALQIVGILAALATLVVTRRLALRLGAPPVAAGAAAALVAASPGFAFMANVGSSDVAGTAVGAVAVLALMAAVERPELLPLGGAVVGLAIGVRPQIAAVFAPALVWAVWRALRDRRWGKAGLAAGLGLAVAAACWVPAILTTGPHRWLHATTNQIHYMATVEHSYRLPAAHVDEALRYWFVGSLVGWEFAVPFWLLVATGLVALIRTGRGRLAAAAGLAATSYLTFALFTMNMTTPVRYFLPALPYLAILAAGVMSVRAPLVRGVALAAVALWCGAAIAWAYPAFRERLKPAPVWAALTWVREHCDPANTRVIYHGVAGPHAQYVLGRSGFKIFQLGRVPVFEEPSPPGEQTLFVTPLPVPGAELLFEAHQHTDRVVRLAWGRYGSCAVSRLRTSTQAAFSPEWQVRRDGWLLVGTGRIHLPIGSKPALVRLCAGWEPLTMKHQGGAVETVKPRGCVSVPLMPGPAGELAVSAPGGSATLVPPVQILPLAALEATDRLASAYMVPLVARTAGHLGSFWRTDLVVINPQKHALRVTAQFLPTGTDNRLAATAADTLAPGQILDVPDVLTLGAFEDRGKLGAMLVHATDPAGPCTGSRCNFLVLSRTYNSSASPGEWRAVEWITGVAPADAIRRGDRAIFTKVSSNSAVRTSLGLASWSAEAMRVRVRVFARDGALLQALEVGMLPFGHLHFPLATQVTDGRVEVEIVSGGEHCSLVAYTSAVESTSGLPAHLLPERIPGPGAAAGFPEMPRPLPSD
jgi:hypothetical protein